MEYLLGSLLKFMLFLLLSSLVIFVFLLYEMGQDSLNAVNRFQSGDTIICNSTQVNNKFYSLSDDGRHYLNKLDNSSFSKYDCK